MGTLADVLEPLARPIRTTRADATVLEAVEQMCRWHVRDLVIGDATDPVGIVCERDILERVVLHHLDPAKTKVEDVMSRPVVSLRAECTPEEALEFMNEHHVHQVPVAGDETLIGMVSATDLRRWALECQDREIRAFVSYIMGR